MNFAGEVERILVALALETRNDNDRYIITGDSDFGNDGTEKAEQHADIPYYLINQLQLTVHDAGRALSCL